MSGPERKRPVAVVTDSGVSKRPGDPEVGPVTLVPLVVSFFQNGRWESVPEYDISPDDFYNRMRGAKPLPKTSGITPGAISQAYLSLAENTDQIFSIHISSILSSTFSTATLQALEVTQEKGRQLAIEVLDSEQISGASWFLVQEAVRLSQKGADLREIRSAVLDLIPKVNIIICLDTWENLKEGGRGKEILARVAQVGSFFKLRPIIRVKDGDLKPVGLERTLHRATERMIQMVGDSPRLVKVAVLHTNAPEKAAELVEALGRIYKGEIPTHDAGPPLATHAGEGALAVAFQTI